MADSVGQQEAPPAELKSLASESVLSESTEGQESVSADDSVATTTEEAVLTDMQKKSR